MSFLWKYWLVKCRNCEWFTQFFPPDQLRNRELESLLKETRCPNCKAPTRTTWHG